MIRPSQLKPGLKFNDPMMTTQPAHRRIHIITDVGDGSMKATHIATGAERTFNTTTEALDELKVVPSEPDVTADLDCLVGERVTLSLKDGGRVKGRCTGIIYHAMDIAGTPSRTVSAFELDKSGTTTYKLTDLSSIACAALDK
jgi:hypothetical protein